MILCVYINPLLTKDPDLLKKREARLKQRIKKDIKDHKRVEVKVFEGEIPAKHKKHEAWVVIKKC